MQKKIHITLLLVMSFAILAFSAEKALAEYESNVGTQGNFEVSVIINVAPCSDAAAETCTTFDYDINQLPTAEHAASHLDLIIEKPYANLIVSWDDADGNHHGSTGVDLDCDGSGDPSTIYARYHTWNCFYKFNDPGNVFLEVRGEVGVAPTDWFIKAGNDANELVCPNDNTPYDWGVILAPAVTVSKPASIIAKTMEQFTYYTKDANGATITYSVTVYKDLDGNIYSIQRTPCVENLVPSLCVDGEYDELVGSGVPIDTFEICYNPDPVTGECAETDFESLKFITDQIVTKTGDHSTCAYWYNGYYYNFCAW